MVPRAVARSAVEVARVADAVCRVGEDVAHVLQTDDARVVDSGETFAQVRPWTYAARSLRIRHSGLRPGRSRLTARRRMRKSCRTTLRWLPSFHLEIIVQADDPALGLVISGGVALVAGVILLVTGESQWAETAGK